jgi:hypothetical protein
MVRNRFEGSLRRRLVSCQRSTLSGIFCLQPTVFGAGRDVKRLSHEQPRIIFLGNIPAEIQSERVVSSKENEGVAEISQGEG